MKRIPRSREVEQAIVNLVREVKAAVKELNSLAGTLLGRGKYDSATMLVETAKEVTVFQGRAVALRKEWRALRRSTFVPGKEKQEATPVWKFYRPIVRVLAHLNGRARRVELEGGVESALEGLLVAGDLELTSKGVPKWKITVRRARAPMIREGFIAYAKGFWSLTDEGRRLADQQEDKAGEVQARSQPPDGS